MNNSLLYCILNRNIKTLQDILEKNTTHINKEDMLYASAHAAFIQAKDIVNIFLSKGLSINDILTTSVNYSLKDAIHVLHEMGGDVNYQHNGYTLLTLAAIQHSTECMENLLYCGAQLNLRTIDGETCLTCIPRHFDNYTKEVHYLVAKGADVNLSNTKGETPLHVAAEYKNLHILQSLLSIGVQINHQNDYGETALMIAAQNHHHECVLLLLQHGADQDLQSLSGNTALMNDISNIYHGESSHEIINLLLQNGCNVNIPNNKGETPLFLSIMLKERTITSKLMSFGANIFTEDNSGFTPFLASITTGNYKLAAQLIDMECYVSKHTDWKYHSQLKAQLAIVLCTIGNKPNCEILNKLFFGAGETIPIELIYKPHIIAITAMEIKYETLMTITRYAIRSYLLQLSHINLIAQIAKLPLPTSLKDFLYFL